MIVSALLASLAIIILLNIIIFYLTFKSQIIRADNARRTLDIQIIADEVYNKAIEGGGSIPKQIDDTLRMIGASEEDCAVSCQGMETQSECLNLNIIYNYDKFNYMPYDPRVGSHEKTYYAIKRSENDRIKIYACESQGDAFIYISQ